MSWTDSFPIMSEDMVAEFQEQATPEEKEQLEEWYGVSRVYNRTNSRHLLSMSVFWKPSAASSGEYPVPTRELLKGAAELGLDLRFEPWEHYIQPVLDAVPQLMQERPDLSVRIYLAADLEFLVEDFINAGCEIFLMRHSSIAHAPGVAWRLLAMEEGDRLITVVDSDRINDVRPDLDRTEAMARAGLGCWREPICEDFDLSGKVIYMPIEACQFGVRGGLPVKLLLHAFTWHSTRGNIQCVVNLPACGSVPTSAGTWPNFGFEEWFLAVVVYPRIATTGILTFVPSRYSSSLLLLDIEYCTWSNNNSELIIFPSGDEGCCGPFSPGEAEDLVEEAV